MFRQGAASEDLAGLLSRSLISLPSKSPLSPGKYWLDYTPHNTLVQHWIAGLSDPASRLDTAEMCLSLMPTNLQLLNR